MNRTQAITRVLTAMQVIALVRASNDGIVVEMDVTEYERCQSKLDAWFEVLVIKWGVVLLKEKTRGIAEV